MSADLANAIADNTRHARLRYERASDALAAATGLGHSAERIAELALDKSEAELILGHWSRVAVVGVAEALGRAIRHLADDGSRSTCGIRNEWYARERVAARKFVARLAGELNESLVSEPSADHAAAGVAVMAALAQL
jgi:hypothetical protein